MPMATNTLTTSVANRSFSPSPDFSTSHGDAAQLLAEQGELKSEQTVEAAGATKFNRRSLMNMIVSTAALTAVSNSSPVTAETIDDPIFAAIEAHKAAFAASDAAWHHLSDLEEELPKDLRRSWIDVWETKIVETDDPRWIEAEKASNQLADAETEAAIELINVEPVTLAGAAALMRYVADMEANGCLWPDGLQNDDKPSKCGKKWEVYLHRNIAAVLEAQAA
jgi:hypothetical protein